MHLEASSSSNLLPCHESLPKPKLSSSSLEADCKHLMKRPRAGSRINVKWTLWRGSSCHPKAPASELQGAAAFRKGKILHWGPGCHSQQHTSQWSTISRPALRFQLQASTQNREKGIMTCLWTTGPHYNTSVQVTKNTFLSSPFPKLKQDIEIWRLNKDSEWPRQEKQENFIYQGYFPHLWEFHLLFWLVSSITGYMHP